VEEAGDDERKCGEENWQAHHLEGRRKLCSNSTTARTQLF
jgi:hypothetical protein